MQPCKSASQEDCSHIWGQRLCHTSVYSQGSTQSPSTVGCTCLLTTKEKSKKKPATNIQLQFSVWQSCRPQKIQQVHKSSKTRKSDLQDVNEVPQCVYFRSSEVHRFSHEGRILRVPSKKREGVPSLKFSIIT